MAARNHAPAHARGSSRGRLRRRVFRRRHAGPASSIVRENARHLHFSARWGDPSRDCLWNRGQPRDDSL